MRAQRRACARPDVHPHAARTAGRFSSAKGGVHSTTLVVQIPRGSGRRSLPTAAGAWLGRQNRAAINVEFHNGVSVVSFLDRFRRKPAIPDAGLTPEEAQIAPGVAQVAGTVMNLQVATASRYALAADKHLKDFTSEVQAFAFGVLASALEQKGIRWFKLADVILPFCEAYMPNYENKKQLAGIIIGLGISGEYAHFVQAGRSAMIRFAHNPHVEPTPGDVDDLAIALGFGRCGEP
jgi:hypothetical protein